MGMPRQLSPKSVDDSHHPHTHVLLLFGPLIHTGEDGPDHGIQAMGSVETDDRSQLPGDGKDQVVIRNVEQLIQYTVGPAVRRMLPTAWAEPGFAGVRDHLLVAAGAAV